MDQVKWVSAFPLIHKTEKSVSLNFLTIFSVTKQVTISIITKEDKEKKKSIGVPRRTEEDEALSCTPLTLRFRKKERMGERQTQPIYSLGLGFSRQTKSFCSKF